MELNDHGLSSSPTQSPKQTGFYVTLRKAHYSVQSGAVLKWDDVRYNPGQNFNITTGAYVAPSDGFYSFSAGIWNNKRAGFIILVDGKKGNWVLHSGSNLWDGSTSATINIHVNLRKGQQVQVESYETGIVYGNGNTNAIHVKSYFSGARIY